MDARILLAEDNALLAFDLGQALEAEGFEVIGPAHSVAQALTLIERRGCEAAVLDIDLHGETSEAIALELKVRAIPFITVSAYSREQRPAVFDGIPAFTKPVQHPLLIARLRRCLWPEFQEKTA